MFEKFGNLTNCEAINELAENLLKEGDTESIRALSKENGIDPEIADYFITGAINRLCEPDTAAIGKITVESEELKPTELMKDWVDYLISQCMEDEAMARAVRSSDKTLKGMIGSILKWSYGHQVNVDKDILKASGINASRVTMGEPGMGTAKKLIKEYYLGGAR